MENVKTTGWRKMVENYPWFNCNDCFPIPAYSEFMPSPRVGRKPVGPIDQSLFYGNDNYGWNISEIEEAYELGPGIKHSGLQVMKSLIKMGKGLSENHIHGHNGENLKDNSFWPPELAVKAASLITERYVTLLPMMLSKTQDDKGRVTWSLFGNSIHDPGEAFWKSFYTAPGKESETSGGVAFFTELISTVYNEPVFDEKSLFNSGFRILSSSDGPPVWTRPFMIGSDYEPENLRYLLTFLPFSTLPDKIKTRYLEGKLALLPFPGSLVFWGMPGYNKLKSELPSAGQIPLLNLVKRNRGLSGIKVTQCGWIHEPRPGKEVNVDAALLNSNFQRTHRWQRLHKFQDELNEDAVKSKTVQVLFSTEPDSIGLYDKPMARNSQIWDSNFNLLLDGPDATREMILEAEKAILDGGLFGYRFFYPPMMVGKYNVYLHRPLVAYLPSGSEEPVIRTDMLYGYLTGYHKDDREMNSPVEMWPRMLNRERYLSALNDFNNKNDYYLHQTSLNIISLLDAWKMQENRPLRRSYARRILNISKQKDLQEWIEELMLHAENRTAGKAMKKALTSILELSVDESLPEPLTFHETASRNFELKWWHDIKLLAHGEFINKDNADVFQDEKTLSQLSSHTRDLERLGDYLIMRHSGMIAEYGMEGRAVCGEMPFKWRTDFEFSVFGGWAENQDNKTYERNILVVIPGKNRNQTVILGDHYDTAYMEDIYDTSGGGSGARLSSHGADDNYSASSTLLQAAPVFLKLSKEGRLERDIWLIHLTGEEFPSDCMGARNFCQAVVEKKLLLKTGTGKYIDLSDTEITGVFIMDMIGHNRDDDQNIFQISPGKSPKSLYLARQAHISNQIWNKKTEEWNSSPERRNQRRGKRVKDTTQIPEIAEFLHLDGEIRTKFNPHSSIYNTDGQIFSDTGIPVVLFMENYDISRSGYHDTMDTMENIDLDYGAALAAIAIETVARVAAEK